MVLCFRRASWYEMGLRQPTGEIDQGASDLEVQPDALHQAGFLYILSPLRGGGGQRDRGELHGPGRGYSDITVTEYRAR